MARTTTNQDRTGRQARPAQPNEPPLPWHSGPQPNLGPQEPQFAPNYDVPPTQRPQQAGHGQNQLPWPQAAPANGYPQQQPAPSFQPPAQQPYPQPPYPQHGYQQPAAYPADGQYYAPQQDPHQAYQQAPQYPDLQSGHHGYPQHADPGYPQPAVQPSPYPQQQYANAQAIDPRGYDLGGYATNPTGYADVPTTRTAAQPAQHGYAPEPSQHGQHYGHAQQQDLAHREDEEYDDEDEYEDEDVDPPSRFRFLKIAASLAVAIGIGAGGAYTYKKFGFGPAGSSRPALARADAAPSKLQTSEPSLGDSKSGDRLGSQLPAVVPTRDTASDSDAPSGPRRVQTIPITPNGAPPQAQQPPMRPTISVPGVALDGMQQQAPQQPPVAALPPVTPAPVGRAVAPPPVTAQQRAPVAPKIIANSDYQTAAPKAATPPQKVAVAKAPAKAKSGDAFSPSATVATATAPPPAAPSAVGAPAAAPAPPVKAANNGFVAVLASQGSAVDARTTLDDLQTRFGQILGGKPTDITEFANPKDGKTYYRAIVGPPGSREAAANICVQMKAAGHKDCFTTAY